MDFLSFVSNQVGRALTWTGASSLASARREANSCVVLVYHQVAPTSRHCNGGSAIPPEAFAAQMRVLRRGYLPVSLDELTAALTSGTGLPRRAVHVTFDDGYRGVGTNAAPVLDAEDIPASVYVCPTIVEGGVFWWDDLCDALRTAQVPRLTLRWTGRPLVLDVRHDHVKVCTVLRQLISRGQCPYAPTEAVMWLRDVLRSSRLSDRPEMLTWRELTELRSVGVVTGSHTNAHRRLSDLDESELNQEMADSKRAIEQRTGAVVQALAYPYGGRGSYDSRALAAAANAGYRVAFSGRFGVAHPHGELLDVPRAPVSPHDGRALFAAKLSGAFPLVYRFAQEHVPRRGVVASTALPHER